VTRTSIPALRIRTLNDRPVNPSGAFVLYWMIAARRTRWNFGLQRATEIACALKKPLLILEAVRCDYQWASDRFHRFLLDGMRANAAAVSRTPATYYPYVEERRGEGRGLLRTLSDAAAAVVSDWHPGFFFPRMLSAGAAQSAVAFEAVDSNGLVPLAAAERAFPVARSYRAFVQRTLREHLAHLPLEEPLRMLGDPRLAQLPPAVAQRWRPAGAKLLEGSASLLAPLPIDHAVAPAALEGGGPAASRRLARFIDRDLGRYAEEHNHPDADCTSRVSPYLHFGHIGAHEIFSAVMTAERWTTRRLQTASRGAREGWWGTSSSAETFLDQLVVWRELAFNTSEWMPGYTRYSTLPEWARETLEQHVHDVRPHLYTRARLEGAATADVVWNAAQRQLVAEGWFHGYLRMLWGKKILEWSRTPEAALARMAALMDKYSLDGRDPNSYAGYTWVLGRYDRPWPERPVFGKVRCMTSASARRKLKMSKYLERYGGQGGSAAEAED
jgi:deoxyribodipyrimidine photo-lyase